MNNLTPVEVFNSMSDKDFELVIKANRLRDLCFALSLDLEMKQNKTKDIYWA